MKANTKGNAETDNKNKVVHVAVGVILDHEQRVFISKRLDHLHQGGLWEFPGGKVDPDETTEQALTRELHEELGIVVTNSEPLLKVSHDYSDKSVLLDVWIVRDFSGNPSGCEGQQVQWVKLEKLSTYDFPEANRPIVKAVLSLD